MSTEVKTCLFVFLLWIGIIAMTMFTSCTAVPVTHYGKHRFCRLTYWTGAEDRKFHNRVAMGGRATAAHTVAAAPSVPFGTPLLIPALKPVLGSDSYVVEDRGNFSKWCRLHGQEEASNLVDVYVENRAEMNWLKRIMPDYVEVYR